MRKKRDTGPSVYEGGFKEGNIVVVKSPFNFKGDRIAIVLDKQKWCSDGIPVMLVDSNEPVRNLCIRSMFQDEIRLVARKNEEADTN